MSKDDALSQWTDAATATVDGAVVWLTGNREPLVAALSRHEIASIELTELSSPRSDWKGVIEVMPAGETNANFYLCVE